MDKVQSVRQRDDRTEWDFGTVSVKGHYDRRDKVRVFASQLNWEKDKKPSLDVNLGSEESGWWRATITPAAARELAAVLLAAADFHKDFKPGVSDIPEERS